MSPTNKDNEKMKRLEAQVRREREKWDQSYRGQALKILPHICSHCGREFTGQRLKELTVHHKDNDHTNNPPDGSNWELLCIYCHDNQHTRSLQAHGYVPAQPGGGGARSTFKPFENLKALLGEEESSDIAYSSMKPDEERDVCSLVTRVFKSFVAPQYAKEGVEEFLKFVAPDAMAARTKANHFVLVAEANDELVGMIEMRDGEHICLLFVDESYQRQGIAGELIDRALEMCAGKTAITVHSSPNAVEAYRRLGFQATGPEEAKDGIRFVPMILSLQDSA